MIQMDFPASDEKISEYRGGEGGVANRWRSGEIWISGPAKDLRWRDRFEEEDSCRGGE